MYGGCPARASSFFDFKLYLCGVKVKIVGMKRLVIYILSLLALASCAAGGSGEAPKVEEALYHFYTGKTYLQEQKFYDAMEEMLLAEELCLNTDKVVLKGQICYHKGLLYVNKMDYSNALEMFSNALEFYALAGSDVREHIMYAYEGMARVYAINGNPQESVSLYRKASEMAVQMRSKMLFSPRDSVVDYKENLFNRALMEYSTAIAAEYCKVEGGADKALAQLDSTYSKFNDSLVNPLDYPLLAKIHLQKNNLQKASECLKEYSAYLSKENISIHSPDKLLELYTVSAQVAQRRGDFRSAFEYSNRYIALKDSLEFAARSESVREAEQQFVQRRLEEENYRMKMRGYRIAGAYILGVLVFVTAVVLLVRQYRRRLEKKDMLLAEYANNMDALGSKVASAENQRENLLSQLDVHKAKEKELKDLLENRFAEVKELVRTYYEFGDSKKLHKKVDDLLKMQLSGDNFAVMEQVVNAKNNDVIRKVRERYPNMREDNVKLLCLIYAGFSAQEISVILNDTPQNIYVRKSRLKKSLQELILEDPQMNFS